MARANLRPTFQPPENEPRAVEVSREFDEAGTIGSTTRRVGQGSSTTSGKGRSGGRRRAALDGFGKDKLAIPFFFHAPRGEIIDEGFLM